MAGTAMAQTTENSPDPISETPTVIPSKIPADISPGIPPNIPTEERIVAVLRHLGISSAHFAGRAAADWTGLAQSHPDAIASLALIFPSGFDPKVLASVAPRLLVFRGDQGPSAEMVERNLLALPEATLVTLPKYHSPNNYADVAVERGEDIRRDLGEFLDKMEERKTTASNIAPVQAEGEVAGISYRVQGSGPAAGFAALGRGPLTMGPPAAQSYRKLQHHNPGRRRVGIGGQLGIPWAHPRISRGCGRSFGPSQNSARRYGVGGRLRHRSSSPLAGPAHRSTQPDPGHRRQSVLPARGRCPGQGKRAWSRSSGSKGVAQRRCPWLTTALTWPCPAR